MASQKKTNAVRILENAKIPFELIEYEVDESSLSAEDAALKTGVPEEQTFKTLCVRGDKTGVMMVCLPAGRELDFKALGQLERLRPVQVQLVRDRDGHERQPDNCCSAIDHNEKLGRRQSAGCSSVNNAPTPGFWYRRIQSIQYCMGKTERSSTSAPRSLMTIAK